MSKDLYRLFMKGVPKHTRTYVRDYVRVTMFDGDFFMARRAISLSTWFNVYIYIYIYIYILYTCLCHLREYAVYRSCVNSGDSDN